MKFNMKKAIKIGFPILCVVIIGGTFILLNKTTERINKNRLKEDDIEIENTTNSTVTVEVLEDNENVVNNIKNTINAEANKNIINNTIDEESNKNSINNTIDENANKNITNNTIDE